MRHGSHYMGGWIQLQTCVSQYSHAGGKSRTDCIHRNAQNRPELRKFEQKPMTPRPTSVHANEGSVVNGFFGYVNGYAFVTCLSFQLNKINFHVFFFVKFFIFILHSLFCSAFSFILIIVNGLHLVKLSFRSRGKF